MVSGNGADAQSLDFTWRYNPPVDPAGAERMLKEVKEILDRLGIAFLLSSGTCLGAVRDGAIIPWDDDLDIMTVTGANGLTDAKVDEAVSAFKERGFYVRELAGEHRTFSMIKGWVRTGWDCFVNEGEVVQAYPKSEIPVRFLTQPKEITFLGERFFVPNPPEEYLRLKYGEAWRTPKRAGEYELDVVEKIAVTEVEGTPCRVRVLDAAAEPVGGADVVLVGGGRSATDASGYADVILPGPNVYAMVIRFPGHENVLYMEELEPGVTYVYGADSAVKAAQSAGGTVETLGNLLTRE